MRRALSCWPLALLFLAVVAPSKGQSAAPERELVVAAGAPLAVECPLRPEQRAEWRLDGGAVPGDMRPGEAGGPDAALARLLAAEARAHHAGLYSCARDSVRVRVRVTGAEPAGTAAARPEDPRLAFEQEQARASKEGGLLYYDFRGNFSLDCSDLADDNSVPIAWFKNGTALEQLAELRAHVLVLPAGGAARGLLTLGGRAAEADWGNYSCSAAGRRRHWRVHNTPHAKLPADTNVVEGQKLTLTCKLLGQPYPAVEWTYSNSSEEFDNGTAWDVVSALGDRVNISDSADQKVKGAVLVVNPAQRSDAGWYRCTPVGGVGTAAVTRLRVKDMYAALWPFLGICAEVFVLCAIILVYEKRRTKPELDDSDTDNHDQKKS